jgi:transposase
MRLHKEELPTVLRRREAGIMLMEGASLTEVADKLHLSLTTVRKYSALVEGGGLEALGQLSVGGRPSILDADAMQWIAATLMGSARDHGFGSDAWTSGRLRDVIARRYGVTYSRVYAWQIATNLGLGHRLTKSKR